MSYASMEYAPFKSANILSIFDISCPPQTRELVIDLRYISFSCSQRAFHRSSKYLVRKGVLWEGLEEHWDTVQVTHVRFDELVWQDGGNSPETFIESLSKTILGIPSGTRTSVLPKATTVLTTFYFMASMEVNIQGPSVAMKYLTWAWDALKLPFTNTVGQLISSLSSRWPPVAFIKRQIYIRLFNRKRCLDMSSQILEDL